MTSSQSLKNALRREKRLLRKSLSADIRCTLDHAVAVNLENLPAFREAEIIAGFISDGTEPDLMPVLRRALDAGKKILLPRWKEGSDYEMVIAEDLHAMVSGKWGIPEPGPDAEMAPLSLLQKAFYLVPGVAFDASCGRLGRGKGVYDRFLAASSGISAGIFYECQKAEKVPMEPHDTPLDFIVTERTVYQKSPETTNQITQPNTTKGESI